LEGEFFSPSPPNGENIENKLNINEAKTKMSEMEKLARVAKPTGFSGRMLARFMAVTHKTIFKDLDKNVVAVLNLQPEDDYLEIGFGSGSFMKSYASHVQSIAGLDHSEDMVRLATRYNRKRFKAGTAEFRQGEASLLPWGSGRFSVVLAMESFFFFPKPTESLKEIHRVLRPGGRLVISLSLNADDGTDPTVATRRYPGIRLYTGNEMQARFQEVGFSESSLTYSKGFMMPKLMIACAIK
jgi:SAM-dependent methyltransferase